MGLESTAFVAIFTAHRAIRRIEVLTINMLQFNPMQLNYWPNTCSLLQSSGFDSSCSHFFIFSMVNLGKANGA